MKTRLISALFAACAFLGLSAPSQAQQFSQVIVFGDSLSDAGYYRPVLGALGVPASLLPTLGRFTTAPGPVWAELVAAYYGAPTGPSNVNNGNIFAQGGARVAANSTSTPPGAAQRPVTTQISEYLARGGGAADPNALYAIWAGANDVIQTLGGVSTGALTSDQASAAIQAAANAEIQQIGRLQAAGARYIVVFGLPNIGATPGLTAAGATAAAGATQLSAGYNTALFAGLAGARIRVIPVDAFTLLSEVRANPAAFGFSNITTPACGAFAPFSSGPDALFCPPNVWLAANANQTFLFADGIHPTTAAHALIAQFVEAMIDGPNQYSMMAEAVLRTRAGHLRTLNDGLTLARNRVDGERWHVFAAIDHGVFEVDNEPGIQGVRNSANSGSVGITTNLSETVTLGIAAGQSKSRNQFMRGNGNFNTNEKVYSLFGSVRMGGLYGTGVVSISDITYGEIQRTITLGPLVRKATSRAEGTNVSASFNAGYDLRFRAFTIGPTLGVTTQHVEVGGFDETGADSSNLRIYSQTRRSEVWSVGARATLDLGEGWMPWVRVTADKERRDDVRVVSASPLSMATGNIYDIPAYMPDTTFTSFAAGIRGVIAQRLGLGLSYYAAVGRSGIRDDGVSLLLSYRF